ncbi:mitochondrial outer membrane fission complex, WD repeat subunit Mdv1 [Schizosaccharomyces osmophilus]|uniref:Mitochondrial outer membrane fission complex, WD repeat subunit Mdv1 n=1 Tax=Schizosaccharomyces osmophilus TaxID=2545709 RepID=A0AAE9W963_9SCHI|nr:mitochondrial outer membrane fission complex, WD repeat subunit Mdv1 [Schizosaccharomyces osmophilus]WBW72052.1 mitochondrial outer membrane fission complex, WD repeat subunit Mdv1 [Schizosaccharomyces osmophilus]
MEISKNRYLNSKPSDKRSQQRSKSSQLTAPPTILQKGVSYWSKVLAVTTWSLFESNPSNPFVNPVSRFLRSLSHPFVRPKLTPANFGNWITSQIHHEPSVPAPLPESLLREIPDSNDTPYSLLDGYEVSETKSDNLSLKAKNSGSSAGALKQESQNSNISQASSNDASPASQHRFLVNYCRKLHVRRNVHTSELVQIDAELSKLHLRRRQVLNKLNHTEDKCLEYDSQLTSLEKQVLEVDSKELIDDYVEGNVSQDSTTATGAFQYSSNDSQKLTAVNKGTPSGAAPTSASNDLASDYLNFSAASASEENQKDEQPTTLSLISGTPVKQFQAHSSPITSLDFSHPFGNLVTASLDKTVKVWDMAGVVCLGQLEGHEDYVSCLAMQDSFIATGSMDSSVRLWNLENGTLQNTKEHSPSNELNGNDEKAKSHTKDNATTILSSHTGPVTALTLSSDDVLLTGANDKTVRQWDIITGRCIQTLDFVWADTQDPSPKLTTVNDPTYSITNEPFIRALDCLDAAVASGTVDGLIRIWDLRVGLPVRSFFGHTAPVSTLQFDSNYLYSGSFDNSVRIWDLRSGSPLDIIPMEKRVSSLRVCEGRLAVAAEDPSIRVFDVNSHRTWICSDYPQNILNNSVLGEVTPTYLQYRDRFLVDGKTDGSVSIFSA